jgi:hypothetical protein
MQRIAVLVLLVISAPTLAQTPTDVDQLVVRLGDASFERREEAAQQLARLGREAIPSLERGLKHRDAEVRHRVELLYVLAKRSDQERNLDALLLDPETPAAKELPGWGQFRERYGQTYDARDVYVRMVRAEPELMQSLKEDKCASYDTTQGATMRCFEKAGTEGDGLTALLLLGSREGVTPACAEKLIADLKFLVDHHLENLPTNPIFLKIADDFLRRHLRTNELESTAFIASRLGLQQLIEEELKPFVRDRIQGGRRPPGGGECLHLVEGSPRARLGFAEWCFLWDLADELRMEDAVLRDLRSQAPRLMESLVENPHCNALDRLDKLAEVGDPEDISRMALTIACNPAVAVWNRTWAIRYLSRSGRREFLPKLEPLLNVTASYGIGNDFGVFRRELRDMVLAALVHFSGQSMREYQFRTTSEWGPDIGNVFFERNDDRIAAFARWKKYVEDQRAQEQANARALKDDPDGAAILRLLGSDSYREREEADLRIRQLGKRAQPLLKPGIEDHDPEIAARCRALLAAP